MKRVLVTGATGFIGRHVLPLLKIIDYEVHAVSKRPVDKSIEDVHWHQTNLLASQAVEEIMEEVKPTHLLHLAWYTQPGLYWESDENLRWLQSGMQLLECFAKNGGERVVIAGTCAEYDWAIGHCQEHETPCKPQTLYGASKLALGMVVDAYCRNHNISMAWGRIFFLFGPGEARGRFVPYVINGLIRKEQVKCSSGTQIRDFLYVKDVASAFVSLLNTEVQGAVNVASGESISLKEIAEKAKDLMGSDGSIDFDAIKVPKNDPAILTAETNRLNKEVDWRPEYSLDEALREYIGWCETQNTKSNHV